MCLAIVFSSVCRINLLDCPTRRCRWRNTCVRRGLLVWRAPLRRERVENYPVVAEESRSGGERGLLVQRLFVASSLYTVSVIVWRSSRLKASQSPVEMSVPPQDP